MHKRFLAELNIDMAHRRERQSEDTAYELESRRRFSDRMRTFRDQVIDSSHRKPVWALTEAEVRDNDEQDLLEYASTLNYEDTIASIEDAVVHVDTPPSGTAAAPIDPPKIPIPAPFLYRQFFDSCFNKSTPRSIERNLVVSEDVSLRTLSRTDPSRLPYLRQCPFV